MILFPDYNIIFKSYKMNFEEISNIKFGLYSSKEISDMSVCEVNNIKKNNTYNTVYDPRMGATSFYDNCETCGKHNNECIGHFGHIKLVEYIVHPLYYKRVLDILKCFCFKCYNLILSKEQLELYNIQKYKNETKINMILKKVKKNKTNVCCQMFNDQICAYNKPEIKINSVNNTFYLASDDNNKTYMTNEEIYTILNNISDEQVSEFGLDPTMTHPRNFIIKMLPVLPPCDRPFIKTDGKICDDDLTLQYIEIVKLNNQLKTLYENTSSSLETNKISREKLVSNITFRILTMFNNSQGKARHNTTGRTIKSIKERITGKDGQLRNNMMGKRCDYTSRTVIGPEPTLKINEIGVPEYVANILTKHVRITTFNIDNLQDKVDNGLIKTIIKNNTVIDIERYRLGTQLIYNDVVTREGIEYKIQNPTEFKLQKNDIIVRNGKKVENICKNRQYKLQVGWIVNHPLENGDYVLLNRQPTLHKASMMSMRIKIMPHKTFRMNLSITKPFNADFDGDEMNIHVPQSLEAQVELEYLSDVQHNMISHQSSKPNMCIVQDSLLGAYKMTCGVKSIPKEVFFDIVCVLPRPPWIKGDDDNFSIEDIMNKIEKIETIHKKFNVSDNPYNGYGLVSIILPDDFDYEKDNNDNEIIKVIDGVLYDGKINKTIIGSTHNAIHQVLYKEYGNITASYFVDCIQFITNKYLLIDGFTVGLGDCLMNESKDKISNKQKIKEVIVKSYIEAEGVIETTNHPSIKEIRVNASLNKAKDVGLKIAKETLKSDNNFLTTVYSGSKGDFFNIAQITGLLGQQNLKGSRIPMLLNNGKRSLPHYSFEKQDIESKYESRGFISNGFLHGLNPRQFFFHAMSGREGICDTAMGTATSGYMQRRIIKLTEDIKINYDGTVRDHINKIYQLSYDNMNLDPTNTVKVKGKQQFCDIDRLVNKLNKTVITS